MNDFENDVEFYHYLATLQQETSAYLSCVPTEQFRDEKFTIVAAQSHAANFKYNPNKDPETEQQKQFRLQEYLTALQHAHSSAYQLYLQSQ